MQLSTLLVAACCLSAAVVDAQLGTYPTCNATTPCPTGYPSCSIPTPCRTAQCGPVCASGYKLNVTATPYYTCVWPTKLVGATCANSVECMGLLTTCSLTTGNCTCQASSYTVKSDSTDCTPPAAPTLAPSLPLGAACTYTFTCGVGTTCSAASATNSTKVCQCTQINIALQDGVNCRLLQIGDPCNSTNCPDTTTCPMATCSSGTFQCVTGYTAIPNGFGCYNASLYVIPVGGQCSITSPPNNQYCTQGLTCASCAENTTVAVCQGQPSTGPGGVTTGPTTTHSAGSVMSSALSPLVLAALLYLWHLL